MKRFLAFYGYGYEAGWGMDDFIGDYDELEEAVNAIEKLFKSVDSSLYYYGQIWDTETRSVVWSKE